MSAAAIAAFWILAAWGMAGRGGHRLIYLFFASLPFMSFAVLPVDFTGGLTVTPPPVVGLLIVGRVLLARRGVDALLTDALGPRRLLLLTLFWVVAVVVTIFMPRILAGRVLVVPVRAAWLGPVPLAPSAQNLSQLAYLTVSVLLVMAFAGLFRDEGRRQHGLRAICLGAAVAVATGMLDALSFRLPLEPLLAAFRTASYALLVSDQVLGAKRVVGLMPEASSYGLLCVSLLTLLTFFRRAIASDRLRRVVPPLQALLVVCVWLSTSSAAYVGLAVLAVVAAVEWGRRAAGLAPGAGARRGLAAGYWLALTGTLALLVMVVAAPQVLEQAVGFFDKLVVQKPSSSSFAERSSWTATSWRALLGSGGIGVGVGSTRASSSVVAIVSGTGLLGGALWFGFVLQTFFRTAQPGDARGALLLHAVRWAFLPPFAIEILIGTSADFGPIFAFLFGLSAAVAFASEPGVRSVGPSHAEALRGGARG